MTVVVDSSGAFEEFLLGAVRLYFSAGLFGPVGEYRKVLSDRESFFLWVAIEVSETRLPTLFRNACLCAPSAPPYSE